jgi:hypothetical protein
MLRGSSTTALGFDCEVMSGRVAAAALSMKVYRPHHDPPQLAETGAEPLEASGGVLREQDVGELAFGLGAADAVGRVGETQRRLGVDDLEELLDAPRCPGGVLVGRRNGQADGGEAARSVRRSVRRSRYCTHGSMIMASRWRRAARALAGMRRQHT